MADFAAVLRKTIAALKENTPETRDRIYQKARSTIEAKLKAVSPPPSAQVIENQMRLLEDAIQTVEAEFTPVPAEPPEPKPESDFDQILRDLEALSTARWSVADKTQSPVITTTAAATAQAAHDAPSKVEDAAPSAKTNDAAVASETPAFIEKTDTAPEAESQTSDDAEPTAELEHAANGEPEPVVDVSASDEANSSPISEEPEIAPVTESRQGELGDEGVREAEDEAPQAEPASADEAFEDRPALRELRTKKAAEKRSRKWPLVAAVVLLLFGAGAVGAWFYRDDVVRLAGLSDSGDVTEDPSAPSGTEVAATPGEENGLAQPSSDGQDGAANTEEPLRKLTQRLLPDGSEVDDGPAAGQSTIGEGTSIAASTERPAEEAGTANNQPDNDAAVAVGQKAIFYEERTIQEQASASNGNVVWTVSQESPGADLPPEPVIYAEATIPDKRLRLKMSIRRNVDQSLPASYIAELIFLTPEDFSGGAVGSVASVSLKRTEQDAGNRLLGVPAKIADGFFLVALSDNKADVEANTLLLERMEWIDIPIVYTSGRRALITLEKGVPGGSVFNQALTAWKDATSG